MSLVAKLSTPRNVGSFALQRQYPPCLRLALHETKEPTVDEAGPLLPTSRHHAPWGAPSPHGAVKRGAVYDHQDHHHAAVVRRLRAVQLFSGVPLPVELALTSTVYTQDELEDAINAIGEETGPRAATFPSYMQRNGGAIPAGGSRGDSMQSPHSYVSGASDAQHMMMLDRWCDKEASERSQDSRQDSGARISSSYVDSTRGHSTVQRSDPARRSMSGTEAISSGDRDRRSIGNVGRSDASGSGSMHLHTHGSGWGGVLEPEASQSDGSSGASDDDPPSEGRFGNALAIRDSARLQSSREGSICDSDGGHHVCTGGEVENEGQANDEQIVCARGLSPTPSVHPGEPLSEASASGANI